MPNAEFKAKLKERIKIGEEVELMLSQDAETNLNKISKKVGSILVSCEQVYEKHSGEQRNAEDVLWRMRGIK